MKLKNGLTRLWRLKESTKLCTDFYVFDTETGVRRKNGVIQWCLDARQDKFIFGVIYGYNFHKIIYTVEEMRAEFLDKRYKGKKVFAHNAQYDLNVCYGNIFDFDPKAIFNGKFISATNGNCTFADSMNIFVGLSVAAIGKMMKNDKLGMTEKSDYSETDWTITKERNRSINGCTRDCQIIWDALVNMFEFAGDIKITQASLSMTYYRRYHQPYHIDHNENTKFFWKSYYGGRCEAFKIGKTQSKVIDVNSMYPYWMKHSKFPNPRTLKHEVNMPIKTFMRYLKWYEGCVYCEIHHEKTYIGYLPYKNENGKLIFPVGTFSGWFNFNELRFALESGVVTIRKIFDVVYSEPMESPFVSYVDTLQAMKYNAQVEENKFEEDRAKRFSNSLYGKFAQHIDEESIYIRDMNESFDLIQKYQREGKFMRIVCFNKKRNDAFIFVKPTRQIALAHAIPSFASYITSAARVHLLKQMLEMKHNKVVYCDTDSIFYEIDLGFTSDLSLGGWKVENKIITNIKGLKNYKYIEPKKSEFEVWKVKGVPVNKGRMTKLFIDDEFIEVPTVEQIAENTFRYYNLVKSKEALRRGIEPGVLTERIKVVKNKYDKRIVYDNGETEPIELC